MGCRKQKDRPRAVFLREISRVKTYAAIILRRRKATDAPNAMTRPGMPAPTTGPGTAAISRRTSSRSGPMLSWLVVPKEKPKGAGCARRERDGRENKRSGARQRDRLRSAVIVPGPSVRSISTTLLEAVILCMRSLLSARRARLAAWLAERGWLQLLQRLPGW